MASFTFSKMPFVLLAIYSSFFLQGTLGEIICEDLPQDSCAFSISFSGKRCLLENSVLGGATEYQCRTSDVGVDGMANWIETDSCVRTCGVDRRSVGISSDSLVEPHFAFKLCSPGCIDNCPNIVDLHFNMAAAEGVFLPDLCEVQRSNPHRSMMGFLSSGAAAGPMSSSLFASAPAPTFI